MTHSTGGLISRSYIQSSAYATGGLVPVHMLIQTGVPNQGTGAPFVMLNNDFAIKSASRLMARILNDVWELWDHGATTIHNPDGSTFTAANEVEFVRNYVQALHSLLATYPFVDEVEDANAIYTALTSSG